MTGVDEMNIYDIYTDICTNGFCAPDTENPTYPLPCVKDKENKAYDDYTLRDWLKYLDCEFEELRAAMFNICTIDDKVDKDDLRGVRFETQFALACANMKSAITTMEDSYGLELFARNEAQRAINRINRVTGRL